MHLHFNEEEMMSFLLKRGYTMMKIKTWKIASRSEEIYSGSAFSDVEVRCVFKDDYPKNDINMDSYTWLNSYGIDTVFNKELKKTLLSL